MGLEFTNVALKAGQGAEQQNFGGIAAEGGAIRRLKSGRNQRRLEFRLLGCPEWRILEWHPEQRKSFFSHFRGPGFQLAMEGEESRSCQEILQFRRWCGRAMACNFTSDAGKDDAVAFQFYVGSFCSKNSEVRLFGIGVAARRWLSNSAPNGMGEWSSFG